MFRNVLKFGSKFDPRSKSSFFPIQSANFSLLNQIDVKKNNYSVQSSINIQKANLSFFSNGKKEFAKKDKRNSHNKVIDYVNSNKGINNFLKNVYFSTASGIVGTFAVSYAVASTSLFTTDPEMTFFGGFAMAITGCFGMGFSYETKTKEEKGQIIHYTVNSVPRLCSYGMIVSGMGITFCPAFIMLSDTIPLALATTSLVFAGASSYIYMKPINDESVALWGPALTGSLFGLVGLNVVNIGSLYFCGHTAFGDLLHNINLYSGIPLFSLLIAYDTHMGITNYKNGDPDHLGTSVELYLDFMNLLIRFMEIIQRMNNINNDD
jgi:FtsH-binding integral membrane protein